MSVEVARDTASEQRTALRTIPALWHDAVTAGRTSPAYLEETPDGWRPISWQEAAERVDALANGLLARGVTHRECFGILASTRLEWALFDFALALVGAVTAPVYASASAHDCGYVLGHSDAVGVLVEDDEQAAKVESVRSRLPRLRHVLTFADLDRLADEGRRFGAQHPQALPDAVAAVGEDDLFTYIYTSGTTGPPKGCMIRHRDYYLMAAVADELDDWIVEGDVLLLYLPLAHNFGRLMHLSGPFAGYTVAFCADPYGVAEALTEVRPTVFPSVPRVYEKIHAAVLAKFDEASAPKRWLIGWALRVGRKASALREEARSLPPVLAAQHRLADRFVYRHVKERLGGRLRLGISGGAPLAPDILRFLHALDILVLEGYGLTECTSACSVNRPNRFRFGTVGPPLPGVEVRIEEDGELVIRTRTTFAGYLKDPEATREVLDEDGWLHTGDVASVDDDGFITITDRKKDILVTAGGKNVAPQNLENELKSSKLISQALVVGDRRPYVAVLITLDPRELATWAESRGLDPGSSRLASHPEVRALVQGIVDEVNAGHSRFEQIKRFVILPRDFSEEHGEVTPTMKLRRKVCQEHFAAEIDELYARPHERVTGIGG